MRARNGIDPTNINRRAAMRLLGLGAALFTKAYLESGCSRFTTPPIQPADTSMPTGTSEVTELLIQSADKSMLTGTSTVTAPPIQSTNTSIPTGTTEPTPARTFYYIDATGGNDENNGTSESTAWKTIAKVNAESFNPGESILFKRGEIWRENLVVNHSGTAGSYVIYGNYGSGNLPKILGSIAKNSTGDWTEERSNIWYTSTTSTHVYQCVFNGEASWSTRVINKADLVTQGEMWWDDANNRVYLYSVGNPATVYSGSIELCRLMNIITGKSKNYIKIIGLDLRYSSRSGIFTETCEHWIVDRCTVKFTGETFSTSTPDGEWSGAAWYSDRGSYLVCQKNHFSYNWEGFYMACADTKSSHVIDINNNVISYSIIHSSSFVEYGISLGGNGTGDYSGSYIRNNSIFKFGKGGISLSHATNVIVEHNSIHDNYTDGIEHKDCGIEMSAVLGSHIVRYNHIYNITGDTNEWGDGVGIWTRTAINSQVYYNIVHDVQKGFYNYVQDAAGDNTGNKIYNNLFYNCGTYGIWVMSGYSSGQKTNITIQNNICDGITHDIYIENNVLCTGGYNCLINDASVPVGAGSTYTNTDSADLYETDPEFTNPGAFIFTLKATSACIDAGKNVKLTEDFVGIEVPQGDNPEIGTYEYVIRK